MRPALLHSADLADGESPSGRGFQGGPGPSNYSNGDKNRTSQEYAPDPESNGFSAVLYCATFEDLTYLQYAPRAIGLPDPLSALAYEDELVYTPPTARRPSHNSTSSAQTHDVPTGPLTLTPAEGAHLHVLRGGAAHLPLRAHAQDAADGARPEHAAGFPRTIFAILDKPPTWPGADDDDGMALESVSDVEEEPCFDDGDVSSMSHAPSSSASHAVSSGIIQVRCTRHIPSAAHAVHARHIAPISGTPRASSAHYPRHVCRTY
ncbi:hypothetical protein FB451DRAFT_1415273 [Mycena latifolia]|nr:hypothetical protein FB451DRAFT_1415273 [Mycena latifolia]